MTESTSTTVVWDLPTRLFHWMLVIAFTVAFATGEKDTLLSVHLWSGSIVMVLLLFRLIWGFLGTRHARFADFAYSPAKVMDYLKGVIQCSPPRFVGHNPPGGWAIFILLALGVFLTFTGVAALVGEEGRGPLAGIITIGQGKDVKEIHEAIFILMVAMVGIHLAGVVVESWLHRENLLAAMFHGRKRVEDSNFVSDSVPTRPWVAALLVVCALVIPTILFLPGSKPFWAKAPGLRIPEVWKSECGECHMAFPPSLLPSRSWDYLLKNADNHFGEVLTFKNETLEALRKTFANHSAEEEWTESAHKINRSLKKDQVPLRISDTPYWFKKHAEIKPETWNNLDTAKARCEKCHSDAYEGIFDDSAITWHHSIVGK